MFEKDKNEKKKYRRFSLISGVVLLIIAVVLVLSKNGVNFFGKEETPEEMFVSANMQVFDKVNEELLEYLSFCGDNARNNGGHLKSQLELDSEQKLLIPENSLIGLLFGALGLDQLSRDDTYDLMNEDGVITVVRKSDGSTVYSKETIMAGMDFSKLGKTSALKEKAIKKLLVHYEKMFLAELCKDGITFEDNKLVNIDNIIMVEKRLAFDFSRDDIRRAMEAVMDDVASDKKWQKAFASMKEGDFKEYMETVKEKAFGEESLLGSLNDISGALYLMEDGHLNFAELTFDVDDKAIEAKLAGATSWLLSKAIDVEPVFTVSVGYTLQSDSRGFRLCIENADGETKLDVTGHGTVVKSGLFGGSTTGFTGKASVNTKGQTGELAIFEAQLIDMKKGARLNGNFTLTLGNVGISMEAVATNEEQKCEYEISVMDTPYISGHMNFRDK